MNSEKCVVYKKRSVQWEPTQGKGMLSVMNMLIAHFGHSSEYMIQNPPCTPQIWTNTVPMRN